MFLIFPARRQRGFTLIELMVSLAVLGVIIGLAVPSMRAYLLNQRVRSVAFDLAASLLQARSEAGKRNTNVVISQAAGGWQNGWTIALEDGTLLAQRDAFPDIAVAANYTSITYQETGRVVGSGASPAFTITSIDTNFLYGISPRCVGVTLSGKVTNQC